MYGRTEQWKSWKTQSSDQSVGTFDGDFGLPFLATNLNVSHYQESPEWSFKPTSMTCKATISITDTNKVGHSRMLHWIYNKDQEWLILYKTKLNSNTSKNNPSKSKSWTVTLQNLFFLLIFEFFSKNIIWL